MYINTIDSTFSYSSTPSYRTKFVNSWAPPGSGQNPLLHQPERLVRGKEQHLNTEDAKDTTSVCTGG